MLELYAPGEVIVHARSIYNALDFLGDVGGLFDALKLIGAAIVSVFGTSGLHLSLVGSLFFRKPTTEVESRNISSEDSQSRTDALN